MTDPIIDDVMTPEVLARFKGHRDSYWLDDPLPPDTGLYYCVRCHRHHWEFSAVGGRHAGPQPIPLRFSSEDPDHD
jgi:hypothetical protein